MLIRVHNFLDTVLVEFRFSSDSENADTRKRIITCAMLSPCHALPDCNISMTTYMTSYPYLIFNISNHETLIHSLDCRAEIGFFNKANKHG